MICNKCGNQIPNGMKFCTNCGEPAVLTQVTPNTVDTPVQTTVNTNKQQTVEPQTIQNTVTTQPINKQNIKQNNKGMIQTILFSLIRPVSNFKESEAELSSTSNSAILTGIISAIIMVLNLVISVATTLFTKSTETCFMGYCVGEDLTLAEKFKTIEWWPLVWQYIVIPAGIIFLIAVVYYIVSLIFKKNTKFGKTLGISALSITPALVGIIVLAPLLGIIWTPLSIIVSGGTLIYSISILIVLYYKEFNFDDDDKYILFNLISVFIIIIVGYLIINQIIQQSISGLGNLNSLF